MSFQMRLALAAAVLGVAGCGPKHHFISATTEQLPPPFLGPAAAADTIVAPVADAAPAAPQPPAAHAITFFKTQDSDEWVRRNFVIQASYARVIVVSADGRAPAKIAAGKLDLNASPGREAMSDL